MSKDKPNELVSLLEYAQGTVCKKLCQKKVCLLKASVVVEVRRIIGKKRWHNNIIVMGIAE